ncbi:hypothetical protein [Mycobacterium sp. GA-1841]|uniref:hypothetical protein n=1 Tax=Mycobacterium sp. GA-1841 TaxID=1834154 RepID=UPI0020CA099C|nr:hypothetical protein [Mycobacterium sp. GA-1841]
MVAGPGVAGTAVASAGLFGIDVDVLHIFDHKHKKKKSDRRAQVGAQRKGRIGGPPASTRSAGVTAKVGAGEVAGPAARAATSGPVSQSAGVVGDGQAPTAVVSVGEVPSAAVTTGGAVTSGGGGAAGIPRNGNIGRAPNLAPVPTAPSSRKIVIRSSPPKAPAPASPVGPAVPAAPAAPAPVVVPPAPVITPPAPSAPPISAPSAPNAPRVAVPRSEPPAAQPLTAPAMPESFRVGYADYLRTADTTDLLFAVLPGLGGMVLLTAVGGAAGFRQARAAQRLPSPQIARFLP